MFELLYLQYSRKQFEKLVFIRHFHFFLGIIKFASTQTFGPYHSRGHLSFNSVKECISSYVDKYSNRRFENLEIALELCFEPINLGIMSNS